MSIRALDWAFNLEVVASSQKLVLLTLANFAGETGLSYPSVETLCRLTSLNSKTVRKALSELLKDGVIEDSQKRAGVTRQVIVYRLPECARSTAVKSKHPPKERYPKTAGLEDTQKRQASNPEDTQEDTQKDTQKDTQIRVAEPGTGNHEPGTKRRGGASRFTPPSLDEVKLQCSKISLPESEAEKFLNHHAARGWKFKGGQTMVSWTCALNTWKANWHRFNQNDIPYQNGNGNSHQPKRNHRNEVIDWSQHDPEAYPSTPLPVFPPE